LSREAAARSSADSQSSAPYGPPRRCTRARAPRGSERARARAAARGARSETLITWIAERNVTIEDVDLIITPRRGIEEVVLHIDGDDGRIELPLALAADRDDDARILELRVYFSTGR
jgi:hypothetical protein